MTGKYLKRIVDSSVQEYLEFMGAILIEGPKWCGKTRTSMEFAKSELFITNGNQIKSLNTALEIGKFDFLEGDVPKLIDEWQEVPGIWDAVRFEVDRRSKKGQFILTGSSVPPAESTRHSGAGRIARMIMRPMSLFESGESNGNVSLKDLFDPNIAFESVSTKLTIEGLAGALARGGWPDSLSEPSDKATKVVSGYLDTVIGSDVSRVDGISRNPETARRIVESIARNISTAASMETIRTDVNGIDGKMTDVTLRSYLGAMEKIFLIENLPAWNPHLRSRTKLLTTAKWHFVDPSIALSALEGTKEALLNDFNTFGLLFESLCLRDLRIYSQSLNGSVRYLRNKNGFEVDLIVQLRDGRWGGIEVKLGSTEIDRGAENLLKLNDMVDADNMKAPSFLMVLTAGQYGYKRPDGVLVVPIGSLKD
jgi:predicted AAA+ superfamily ATPase